MRQDGAEPPSIHRTRTLEPVHWAKGSTSAKCVTWHASLLWCRTSLGGRLDTDRAYVSALERGLRNPTVVTLFRISQVIGVPLSAFSEGPDGSEGPTEAPKERELKSRA
jgi:transcriptional regulator with XRE-family HTH domain